MDQMRLSPGLIAVIIVVIVVLLLVVCYWYNYDRECDRDICSSECLEVVKKSKGTHNLRLKVACPGTMVNLDKSSHVRLVQSNPDALMTCSPDDIKMTQHIPVIYTGNPLLIDYQHVNVDNLFIYGGTMTSLINAAFAQISAARDIGEAVILQVTTLITDSKSLVDAFVRKAVSVVPDLDVQAYKASNIRMVKSVDESKSALDNLTDSNINVIYVVRPSNDYELPINDIHVQTQKILFVPYLTYSDRPVSAFFESMSGATFNVTTVNSLIPDNDNHRSLETGCSLQGTPDACKISPPMRYDVYNSAEVLQRLMTHYDRHISVRGNISAILNMLFTPEGYMVDVVRFMTFRKNTSLQRSAISPATIKSGIYTPVGYTDITSSNNIVSVVPYITYGLISGVSTATTPSTKICISLPFKESIQADLPARVPLTACIYSQTPK